MRIDPLLKVLRSAEPGGAGIRAWSVYVTQGRRLSLGTKDCETGSAHTPLTFSESLDASYLLVWKDGRISRGLLEKRQIVRDAEEALALARTSAYDDPDAAQVRGPARFPEIALHDASVTTTIDGDIGPVERRLEAIRERLLDNGFRIWSGSFSFNDAQARLVTSRGLDAEGVGSTAGWYVSFEGEFGDGFRARAPDSYREFEERLDRLAETVRLLKKDVPPLPGGVCPVILHPHVVEDFVMGTILHNLDGASVAHGEGFFKKEQFASQHQALREDLTLRLDPLQPLKSGSYRFTTEGVPATPCTYIHRGRLVSPILDLKYAKRLGLEPSSVPYSMDTLELEASGTLSSEEAYEIASGGALVLSVLGVHTQDPSSGDFSLAAPQTLKLGPAGPEGRIKTTISGNLFEVLRSDALRLVRFEGEHTPALLFPCRLDPS